MIDFFSPSNKPDPEPESNGFIEGFQAAEKEFYDEENPKYVNPFPEGTEQHRGYEEAVYVFTQK